MRKVWQPLRRLLTVGVGSKGRATAQPHPNNVDLNNTQLLLPLDSEDSSSKATATTTTSTHDESIKLQLPLPLQEELTVPLPPCNTPTLIHSVYVEKAATQSCNACQHGRNCQHTHHSSNSSDTVSPASATPTLWDLQLPLPLQYISTDNGTFFWANTQERVDDDLLHAWLCQSFSQLPGTLC